MKTRNLILIVGAAVLTAITFNANAYDPALSPRAAANQIKHISGTNNGVNLAKTTTAVALSPRATDNQIKTVGGTNNDPNVATACRNMMTGSSPKAIQACEANPAMPGCKAAATARATP